MAVQSWSSFLRFALTRICFARNARPHCLRVQFALYARTGLVVQLLAIYTSFAFFVVSVRRLHVCMLWTDSVQHCLGVRCKYTSWHSVQNLWNDAKMLWIKINSIESLRLWNNGKNKRQYDKSKDKWRPIIFPSKIRVSVVFSPINKSLLHSVSGVYRHGHKQFLHVFWLICMNCYSHLQISSYLNSHTLWVGVNWHCHRHFAFI